MYIYLKINFRECARMTYILKYISNLDLQVVPKNDITLNEITSLLIKIEFDVLPQHNLVIIGY